MLPDPLSIAAEIEEALDTDAAQVWFPRCIDPAGGYFENFTQSWRRGGGGGRSLVFQSRMVWFTAQMAQSRPEFQIYCRHGLDYFFSTLLDAEGLPNSLSLIDGSSLSPYRSSYDLAFAIFAMAAAAQALSSHEALDLAKTIFLYLERCFKDPKGHGYFQYADLQGQVQPFEDGETASRLFKHQNPNLHLLEAFTELYRVWPDPLLRTRLLGSVEFFVEDLFREPGYLADHVATDGSPADGRINFGHDVEVAHLLLTATSLLGEKRIEAETAGRRLLDHALERGWDDDCGGIWSGIDSEGNLIQEKIWWVQMEALLALAAFYRLTGETKYLLALDREWQWVRDWQIDPIHRGTKISVDRKGNPVGRSMKGDHWKAAYHDGRAFLQTPRILRGQ